MIAYEVNQTMISRSCSATAISSAAIVLVNTTNTLTVLSGLKACSQYSVQVRAYTIAGPGVFGSIPKHIETTGRMCSVWLTPTAILKQWLVTQKSLRSMTTGYNFIHTFNAE